MMNHVIAVQQAQVAIYGEFIDAALFTRWD
jgi:hypothetical protein